MCTQFRFEEEITDVKPQIELLLQACGEMRSTRFRSVLELVLLIGNYMNAGSRNQQSYGFELNFLTKLRNTKTTDNKKTLVHFLAELVQSDYPELATFVDDMSSCGKAARGMLYFSRYFASWFGRVVFSYLTVLSEQMRHTFCPPSSSKSVSQG